MSRARGNPVWTCYDEIIHEQKESPICREIDIDWKQWQGLLRMKGGQLFTTDVDAERVFLSSFDDEAEQKYHTCRSCLLFLKRYGSLVLIDDNGQLSSPMWSASDANPQRYSRFVDNIATCLQRSNVTGVFYSEETQFGYAGDARFLHFHFPNLSGIVTVQDIETAHQKMARKQVEFSTLRTSVGTWSAANVEKAIHMLSTNLVPGKDKLLPRLQWFQKVLNFSTHKLWKEVGSCPAGWCNIPSSSAGTLLTEIACDSPIETIRQRMQEVFDPIKYQRPESTSVGNQTRFGVIMEKLHAWPAFKRRFARLEEIEKLWPLAELPPYEEVKNKPQTCQTSCTQYMTWVVFCRDVLPFATDIKCNPGLQDDFGAIVTAVHADARPILRWDPEPKPTAELGPPVQRNPFSFYIYRAKTARSSWSLPSSGWLPVSAITVRPDMWFGKDKNVLCPALCVILAGAKDTRNTSLALFPSDLRQEFHEVRASVEAYSKENQLEGSEKASACGLWMFSASGQSRWKLELQVVIHGMNIQYNIDRWE